MGAGGAEGAEAWIGSPCRGKLVSSALSFVEWDVW